ncbi:MAG: LacI family transcriptional regulator [Saprospiraceae bacterium]|nr:LacI family transcriptional regulator [Saprospiraceae bacterium]
MGRITVKDIAKLLNINPSTVSRALKDHPDISKETRDRVKQMAEDLGYKPNLQAISFRSRKSRLIALIIPDMNMYFFPSVIKAIEEKVRAAGYNLIVLHSNNTLAGEIENTHVCELLGVDGLLVSLSVESDNLEHFEELSKGGVPVILFDRIVEHQNFPAIGINDQKVASRLVDHLTGKGCRRIVGVFDNPNLSISRRRKEGYKQGLQKRGLPIKSEWILHAETSDLAQQKIIELLDQDEKPDAIFAMSDLLLVGAMQACQSCGLTIPNDIRVAAISNGLIPNFWQPRITYMEHSGEDVGAKAATILFQLIGEGKVTPMSWVETHLVVQEST